MCNTLLTSLKPYVHKAHRSFHHVIYWALKHGPSLLSGARPEACGNSPMNMVFHTKLSGECCS